MLLMFLMLYYCTVVYADCLTDTACVALFVGIVRFSLSRFLARSCSRARLAVRCCRTLVDGALQMRTKGK